jgi:hypothetical protein
MAAVCLYVRQGAACTFINADVRIGLWQEQNYPPQISLEWLKTRDGITGKKLYFDVIIEPAPESRADDETGAIFVPRGWVGLVPSDSAQMQQNPVEATADGLIPYIAQAPRSVVECAAYVKESPGYGYGKRTVEDALALLVDRGLIVNPNKRGTRAQYHLTDAGRGVASA